MHHFTPNRPTWIHVHNSQGTNSSKIQHKLNVSHQGRFRRIISYLDGPGIKDNKGNKDIFTNLLTYLLTHEEKPENSSKTYAGRYGSV